MPLAPKAGKLSISSELGLGFGGDLHFAGGTLRSTGALVELDFTPTINIGTGGATIEVTGTNELRTEGTFIQGDSGNALTKTGTGTLALEGAAFDGTIPLNLNEGTVSIDGSASFLSINFAGGSLQISGTVGFAGAVAVGADGMMDTNGNAVTLSGTVGGAGSTLTKTGAGTLNFAVESTLTTLENLIAAEGTTNVDSALGTDGNATVSVTGTTILNFGSVSQILSSLSIGAGSTVTFTSGAASGSLLHGGKALNSGTTAVPEPGITGLLLVGALGVLSRRRRQA